MFMPPSGSVVNVLWHMFGSFVLLRALDAVVATAAAEEGEEALTVPFEAVVAFLIGSVATVGTAPESESIGLSAETSSAKWFVSIKLEIRAMTIWSMGTYHPVSD